MWIKTNITNNTSISGIRIICCVFSQVLRRWNYTSMRVNPINKINTSMGYTVSWPYKGVTVASNHMSNDRFSHINSYTQNTSLSLKVQGQVSKPRYTYVPVAVELVVGLSLENNRVVLSLELMP